MEYQYNYIKLLGIKIGLIDLDDILECIKLKICSKSKIILLHVNVYTMNIAYTNSRFKRLLNNATFKTENEDMIIVTDIEFFSLCEHHIIPFFGTAHVGYIPNGKIIGLSKIPRIVEMYGRRLQVQERMTQKIAETLNDALDPKGVAVVLEGRHLCMQMRGVEKKNSYATTSYMIGLFREDSRTRKEFLDIISMNNL